MTRVLFLITEMDVGGAERCVRQLARGLDRARFAPEVAWLAGDGPLAAGLKNEGIPTHPLGMKGKGDLRVAWRLAKLLRARRPAILHTFLFHANLLGRLLAPFARIPVVVSSARVAERRGPWHGRLAAWTSFLISAEVAVSEGVRRLQEAAGVPPRKLTVIPNGIDVSRFDNVRPASLRPDLGISEGATLILYVGRLDPQKGLHHLLEAICRVENLHLILAGHGPSREWLEAEARRLGLDDRTHFLGFRDDVPALLAASDALVLPSLWEGMPNVLLEAAAARRPVVATDVEGVRDIVEDGVTGLIVPPARPDALADALQAVSASPARREKMGEAAREKVACHFSLSTMIQQYEHLYEGLLP